MKLKLVKQVPNFLTLGNLLCGTIATVFAVKGNFEATAFYVVLGIIFDFFDGFAARVLNVSGELGKQLDSLADMVTSGVVPGIVMFYLLANNNPSMFFLNNKVATSFLGFNSISVSLLGLLLTLGACYRLAKFNIDTRQTHSFIGLPTPAMSLFVISLPLILEYSSVEFASQLVSNNYFLVVVTLLLTYLMNASIPLFSLKFKSFSVKENYLKYFFILLSVVLIKLLSFVSIPLIIITYIILSLTKLSYQTPLKYEKSKKNTTS